MILQIEATLHEDGRIGIKVSGSANSKLNVLGLLELVKSNIIFQQNFQPDEPALVLAKGPLPKQ